MNQFKKKSWYKDDDCSWEVNHDIHNVINGREEKEKLIRKDLERGNKGRTTQKD